MTIIIMRCDSTQHFDWNHQICSSDNCAMAVTDLKHWTWDYHIKLKWNPIFSIIFQRNKMLEFVEWEIVKAVWHYCNNGQWVLIHLKIQVWVILCATFIMKAFWVMNHDSWFTFMISIIIINSAYWTCTIIWLWNDCCPKWSSSLVEML